MTTHTIPADHLDAARGGVLVVDCDTETCHTCDGYHCHMHGGLGWGDSHPPAEFVKLTEPCKTCDGSGHATFGNQVRTSEKCPACDGSGRPWLTINVACITRADLCDHTECGGRVLRAHVLDVVPIVDDGENMPRPFLLKDGGSGTSLWWLLDDPLDITAIVLPPGEHVGQYAVLIEPES